MTDPNEFIFTPIHDDQPPYVHRPSKKMLKWLKKARPITLEDLQKIMQANTDSSTANESPSSTLTTNDDQAQPEDSGDDLVPCQRPSKEMAEWLKKPRLLTLDDLEWFMAPSPSQSPSPTKSIAPGSGSARQHTTLRK